MFLSVYWWGSCGWQCRKACQTQDMQYLLLCASFYRRLYQASLLVEGFLFGLSMISLSCWPLQMISSSSLDSQYRELIFQDYLLNHLYKDWGWNLSCLSWRHVMNNVYFLLDIRNLSWLSQPFNNKRKCLKIALQYSCISCGYSMDPCVPFVQVLPNLFLFLDPVFSIDLKDMGLLKASHTSKDQGWDSESVVTHCFWM